jgi:hypothetical protein
MTTQNYLMVQNSVVSNIVFWDGNTDTWQPPKNAIMLVQDTTPAMVWEDVAVDEKVVDYILVEKIGAGAIGFTWNGTIATTNQPKPSIPIYPPEPEPIV